MGTGKRLTAATLAVLGCHLAGCTNALVINAAGMTGPLGTSAASLTKSLPTVDLGSRANTAVLVAVRLPGFTGKAQPPLTTQAQSQKITTDVASYVIDLVANQPGDGGLNPEGLPAYTTSAGLGHNDYSTAPLAAAGATYTMPASDPNLQMQFINVPPGTYRIEVRALDSGSQIITRNTPDNGPPGSDRFTVSTNSVTLATNGPPVYNNTAPNSASSGSATQLEATVQLQDGIGEQSDVFLNVTPGAAIPPIVSTES